jgi:hypothetical protein
MAHEQKALEPDKSFRRIARRTRPAPHTPQLLGSSKEVATQTQRGLGFNLKLYHRIAYYLFKSDSESVDSREKSLRYRTEEEEYHA